MATKAKPNFENDPELKAMLEVFAAIRHLDVQAQNRVLEYVERRLGLQRTPLLNPTSEVPSPVAERDTKTVGNRTDEAGEKEDNVELEGISPIAKKWMQRNQLTESQLSALYSLGVDEIDLVANKVPGKSSRERLRNVLLLQGVASYLSSGAPRIENERLTDAIRHYDADVGRNFSTYLKSWASEINGSKQEGNLTLTTRGLNSAKELIKQMTSESEGHA